MRLPPYFVRSTALTNWTDAYEPPAPGSSRTVVRKRRRHLSAFHRNAVTLVGALGRRHRGDGSIARDRDASDILGRLPTTTA